MLHLFGNFVTSRGIAGNYRGESEGNLTPLQTVSWHGQKHTIVSAEAMRFAFRYYLQLMNEPVNRVFDADAKPVPTWHWQSERNEHQYSDDDTLGYMTTEAAKQEKSEEGSITRTKGKTTARKSALEMGIALSTRPYQNDRMFHARSGEKDSTSIYINEIHETCYQVGFTVTPNHLSVKSRIFPTLDGLISLPRVAGNHSRSLYDFSPDSIVLRWTHDPCPRFFYCFQEDEEGKMTAPKLLDKINRGDIDPSELWIGGPIVETLEGVDANLFAGVKLAVAALKERIASDLGLSE